METAGYRPTTIDSYNRYVDRYIASDPIAHVQLQRLSARDLDGLYRKLITKGRKDGKGGLSNRTVRALHTQIHKALHDACKKRLLQVNPASSATPPSAKSARAPEADVWSASQLKEFLEFVKEDELYPIWRHRHQNREEEEVSPPKPRTRIRMRPARSRRCRSPSTSPMETSGPAIISESSPILTSGPIRQPRTSRRVAAIATAVHSKSFLADR